MTQVPLFKGDREGIDIEHDIGVEDFDVAYTVYVKGVGGTDQPLIWLLRTEPRKQGNATTFPTGRLVGISGRGDH